ncbi:bifunctional 3-(3-hydroxy-phenyl)propionate/3-hydroxycinnamic acid hydroxylase [Streptantibioticus silvisoli]|uniref:Bifunctional 3-(3-hydroxy-phenyl)propionate/3-hydroxycinnamic acid hydroxylase n=1 Tax=Streptantibioticus silvisoli TaxID=2705255 RepID=A0ABT6VZM1_9ACTN|nr:bifunctional 3-(3-hydroxy-phenyl)propionate/3-hydroxycinnamic acid hydroxylase [Streptantibioticus silvisoli]MDI5963945.1 bifunctional 3-(3-hydroxy-phenyl)propionate/3-hydroxycinnamic acid hydroxylase [Streptantibioticus silvisoli]
MDGTKHSDTEVVIVGAGPTGLTLALLLAKRRRTVAVYERWQTVFPLPRAAGMSHETVRTFQAVGLLDELAPHLNFERGKVSTSLFAPGGEELAVVTFPGDGESGFPAMVGFHQPDVDGVLGRVCDSHPLIEMHRGWDATAVEQAAEGAVVTFDPIDGDQPRAGDPVTARARYVVGCDGANSVIRSLMDTQVTDTGFSSSWLVIDTLLRPGRKPLDLFGHVLDYDRPATLAPAGKDRQRFELMVLPGDDPAHLTDDDVVWDLLERWEVTAEHVELARSAVYTFRGRWANAWRDGRLLLAGDAAHQMPPFLGQGFNSGVRDSVALAWRLDLVLTGTTGPELLDSYTTERLPHVREIVEASVAAGQLTCTTGREAVEARVAQFLAMRDGDGTDAPGMKSQWRLGPGCLRVDDPTAGFPSWQGLVEKDGVTGLLDDLVGSGRFVLIGDGVDPLTRLSDRAREVWNQLDGIGMMIGADGYRDVEGTYARWFGELGATVALVRPDMQVYGASADIGDTDALVLSLAAQLRLPAAVPAA